MKTTHLPPVRVQPSVRAEIESCLHDGETLSGFIEQSALEAARLRKAREEVLARGRASLAKAARTGKLYPAADVLHGMRERLASRMGELKRNARVKS